MVTLEFTGDIVVGIWLRLVFLESLGRFLRTVYLDGLEVARGMPKWAQVRCQIIRRLLKLSISWARRSSLICRTCRRRPCRSTGSRGRVAQLANGDSGMTAQPLQDRLSSIAYRPKINRRRRIRTSRASTIVRGRIRTRTRPARAIVANRAPELCPNELYLATLKDPVPLRSNVPLKAFSRQHTEEHINQRECATVTISGY